MVTPVDSRVMETKDILASIEETKALIRRVRTPGGARRYGQPIGSIIVPDAPVPGARRKRSKRTASTPTSTRPDEPKKARQRGPESVSVLAAQVAPSPEVAEGSGEEVEVGAKPYNDGGKGQLYTEGVKYVKNDPLIASAMDFDFMRNGTAEEAHKRLVAMGAKVSVGRNFAKNREFMTALAEVNRILEDEFPGFVARHGVYHSMGVKGTTAAFNAMIHRDSTSEDFHTTGGKAIEASYTMDNVFGGKGQRMVESSELNGTATVFTSGTINGGAQVDVSMRRTAKNPTQSFQSATDIVEVFEREGLSKDQLWMTHVMVHELGHAISMAVAGRMSFEIDGKDDPEQEQRRWYREYYANSRLKFLDEMGIVKWTGKEYVADSLIDQKEYVKTQAELNIPNPPKRPKNPPRNASEKARENYTKRLVEYETAYVEWREERKRIITRQKELANQGKTPSFTPDIEAGDGAMGYIAASSNLHTFFQAHAKAGFIEQLPGARPMTGGVYDWEKISRMTSDYGSTKWVEIEAETWAAYMLNENVTEGVSKWGEQMHTMYQWWTDDDAEMGKNR